MKIAEQKLFQDAERFFNEAKYSQAIYNYSQILEQDPNNRRAKVLTILTEMVMNHEQGAETLYEYYSIIKDTSKNSEDIIESILDTLDGKIEANKNLEQHVLAQQLALTDGISYSEFKDYVVHYKGFKKGFEDVLFSTKLIITNRKELLELLNNLINYGFHNIALNYLENAMANFPADKSLRFIKRKLHNSGKKQ